MTSIGQNFKSRILEFVLRELYIKSENTVLSDKLFCPTFTCRRLPGSIFRIIHLRCATVEKVGNCFLWTFDEHPNTFSDIILDSSTVLHYLYDPYPHSTPTLRERLYMREPHCCRLLCTLPILLRSSFAFTYCSSASVPSYTLKSVSPLPVHASYD